MKIKLDFTNFSLASGQQSCFPSAGGASVEWPIEDGVEDEDGAEDPWPLPVGGLAAPQLARVESLELFEVV